MEVLVTGATGFLGGAITSALVKEGQEVRILARKNSNLNRLVGLQVDIRHGSLEDKSSLISLLDGVECVYHCAAVSTDWAPWNDFYQVNVRGVQNLLEAAQRAGSVQRFVHISSTDVYGYPVKAIEENCVIIDAGLPYNRSKGLGEKAVWDFYQETGLPVTVIRPVTIYGPRSMSIVVEIASLLLKRQMVLIDGGRRSAGLLYIDNAVEAIRKAALSPQAIGRAYNLRDESNETWSQFVDTFAAGLDVGYPWINLPSWLALGIAHLSEIVYRGMGIRSRPLLTRHATYLLCRDQGYPIEKAQQDFGFCSTISFVEGMKRTLTWLASEEGQEALSGS